VDGRVYLVQLLQQPKAGTAMDMRNKKSNDSYLAVGIIYQFADNIGRAQILETFISAGPGGTGVVIITIVATHFTCRQYLVNGFTAMAAKAFFFNGMVRGFTVISAVVTGCFLYSSTLAHLVGFDGQICKVLHLQKVITNTAESDLRQF
jgi:hypothetical protein